MFRDASQKHGPAVNVRRPFTFDLLYHIPELTPFIGKKNPVKKLSDIPVRNLKKKIDPVPAKISSRALQDDEEGAIADEGGVASPRKELTSSATAVRSRSQGPSKLVFRKTRGNPNYNSQERTSTSVRTVGAGGRLKKGKTRKQTGENGIIEQVEEEDKSDNDYDSGEDGAIARSTIKVKRNLLCKTLLDQTKELCY